MFVQVEINEERANAIRVPAQIAPYVEAMGIATTVQFLMNFGGAELYIAYDPKGRSELEALIGQKNAQRLGRQGHLLQRRVPLAKPWVAAVMRASGASVTMIARRLHVSDVTVRKWLN